MANTSIYNLTASGAIADGDLLPVVIKRNKKGQFSKGSSAYRKYLKIKCCERCKIPFKPRENTRKFCSKKCYHDDSKGKTSWNKGILKSDEYKFEQSRKRIGIQSNTGRTHFKKGNKP